VSWRRLKHLASIAVSNVDKKTVSDERSVRLCNYTDVYYNERITAELPFMEATASADQIASFGLRADDVLLTKDSETPDDIAVPAYVVADLPDVVCGYHLALLRPSQEVDGRYLFWALGSRSSREQFSASANGITRFGLRYDSFGEVLVPLPPIATQRAIADYLDRETARIDALIEKKQNLLILLERRLIQLAYSLTVAKGGTIPLRRLVRQVKTGATPPASDFDRLRDGDRPWYSPGDVRSWMVLDTPSRCLNADAFDEGWVPAFPANSTLVVGIGATAGRVAHLGHLASGNQQMTCLVPGPQILPRFLSWQLLARAEELRATAPFTTLPILNNDFLRAIPLFVPTIEKQAAIVGDLDELADKLQKVSQLLGRQITLLQEHRQALITAAVTGELEVPGVAA
jgi:type I restriction enzyme S subunit